MASSFKQDNPGCDCCGLNCEDCDAVTYFTIESAAIDCEGELGAPGDPLCTRNNGTYIFRTVGSEIAPCTWQVLLGGEGCYDTAVTLVQPNAGCSGSGHYARIDFSAVSGGVRVRVIITTGYKVQAFVNNSADYTFTYEDTFATCADAIGATLPCVSVSSTTCEGTDPGDLCDFENRIITIG